MTTETIGERLRRLRLEQGLSQRDLSERGITYAYISRIESGERQPSVKALRKLAVKLGVTTAYLETGSDAVIDSPEYRELLTAYKEVKRQRDEMIALVESFRAAQDSSRDGHSTSHDGQARSRAIRRARTAHTTRP